MARRDIGLQSGAHHPRNSLVVGSGVCPPVDAYSASIPLRTSTPPAEIYQVCTRYGLPVSEARAKSMNNSNSVYYRASIRSKPDREEECPTSRRPPRSLVERDSDERSLKSGDGRSQVLCPLRDQRSFAGMTAFV